MVIASIHPRPLRKKPRMTQPAPKHLLVINDTPAILEVFRQLFEDEGYQVTLDTFSSFDTAAKFDLIRELCPDVIILDFLIGGEPLGWQLLQLLRMNRDTALVPVVVCTAAVRQVEELGAHLLTMGVQVVIKPFNIDDIIAAVSRAIEHRGRSLPEAIEVTKNGKPAPR
jgi:CheY-like chemotaxis protein